MSPLEPGLAQIPSTGPEEDYRDQAGTGVWQRETELGSSAARLSMSTCYRLMAAGHPVDNERVAGVQVSGDNENW